MWSSFCPTRYKVNLVRNLVGRARRICSPTTLQNELDRLKTIFTNNGYPTRLLDKLCVDEDVRAKPYGPQRCPVYIRLPWKGPVSSSLSREINSVVQSKYGAVSVNVVYSTSRAFTVKKDVLPTHQMSSIIYQFVCRQCGSRYVGRTLQHLNARIKQHVPLSILSHEQKQDRPRRGRPKKTTATAATTTATSTATTTGDLQQCEGRQLRKKRPTDGNNDNGRHPPDDHDSAIARHLLNSPKCAVVKENVTVHHSYLDFASLYLFYPVISQ